MDGWYFIPVERGPERNPCHHCGELILGWGFCRACCWVLALTEKEQSHILWVCEDLPDKRARKRSAWL